MIMLVFFTLLLLQLQSAFSQEIVNLTILYDAVKEGAVCLDGSPPAYYFRRGNSEKNWLVFMKGGSWCYGDSEERSCLTRSTTELGSSVLMRKQFTLNFGIFNTSKQWNPDFWNWNHVWINYCDGGSFSGDVDEPVAINKTYNLYYRGRRVWNYIMKDLLRKGMMHAHQAILSGCSAGGVATALLCNDFKHFLRPKAIVKCFMDAGLILDLKDIHAKHSLRSIFERVVDEHNISLGVERHYVANGEGYKQLFPQYLLHSIKQPLFLLNSAYDTWQIRNVLLYPTSEWRPCVESPASCNTNQLEILQGFRASFLKALRPALRRKDWGMFIDSCFHHCQGDVSSVRVHSQTILGALGDWFYDQQSATRVVDFLPWPGNPTCVTYFEDSWL